MLGPDLNSLMLMSAELKNWEIFVCGSAIPFQSVEDAS